MTPVSIAVFIMMLVASGLGFAIAWVYKSEKVQLFLSDYRASKTKVSQLEDEQDSLIRHSNSLQAEKLKFSQKTEKQAKRIQVLKEMVQQLEYDKEFIFKEYEAFRSEVKIKLQKSQKLFEAFDDLKEKNQKFKLKADKWKIKFHETEQKLQETEASYLKVKKEKDQILEKFSSGNEVSESILEWENNYKELKLKYLALTKEKEHLEREFNHTKGENPSNEDALVTKLSQEIVLLKKKNKALNTALQNKEQPSKPAKDKESILVRIKTRSKQVDFNRIGKANPRSTDNLKTLKGLGTLIDQKFRAIGINTFAQMANLNTYDQKLLNFFLELPQGKIESEKWVAQAQSIVGKSNSTKKQVSRNLEKINFDRIGEASSSQKDNLQSIVGIGPYIERKLNAIGIFRIEQLARLTDQDIEEINGIMELAPDHIKNDDWVGQARRMK